MSLLLLTCCLCECVAVVSCVHALGKWDTGVCCSTLCCDDCFGAWSFKPCPALDRHTRHGCVVQLQVLVFVLMLLVGCRVPGACVLLCDMPGDWG